MINKSETVEEVHSDVAGRIGVARSLGEDSMIHNSAVADLLANIDERYIAAHNREIRERDAEIIAKAIIIDTKDVAIKELADVLDGYLACECTDCGSRCPESKLCDHQKSHRALVKKAREMVK